MAWSANEIIMTLLFLGVLLLIIGYFYFYSEGFQNPSASVLPPVSTCISGTTDQKCSASCLKEKDPLPPPNTNEEQSYAIYESHNLVNSELTRPPVVVPTTLRQYNMGGALTANDLGPSKPIPWDFDNATLNPATSMWGTVHSKTSQLIYSKCQCQLLYDDINNLSYDPTSGLFSYDSLLFGTTIYDQREAAALQFGEMFINLELGKQMSNLFEKVNAMPGEILDRRTNFKKEALFKLELQISDYKNAMKPPSSLSADDAANLVTTRASRGDYDAAWQVESQKTSEFPMADSEKVKGTDNLKRMWGAGWGRLAIRKSPLNIDFSNPTLARAKLQQFAQSNIDEDIRTEQKRLSGEGVTGNSAYKSYQNLKSKVVTQNMESNLKPNPEKTTILRRISDFIPFGSRAVANAALRSNTEIAISISKKAITKAQVEIAFNTFIAIVNTTGFVAALPTGGSSLAVSTAITAGALAIRALMLAVQLACNTFIGPLFASFIESDAICPRNSDGSVMWNLNDYFEGRGDGSIFPYGPVAGNVIISILTNLPEFGPLLMAFGPYLCFPNHTNTETVAIGAAVGGVVGSVGGLGVGGVVGASVGAGIAAAVDGFKGLKLKNNLRSPPYYYDPTLSLYNAGSKPKFEAGKDSLDQRLFNPLTFHHNKNIEIPHDENGKPGYPVWVDFANPVMLNKMAQFYYDASRKCPTTTYDGMLTFEYISKFMGLISTTPLTCDVQCEISQITFDPASGVKICETVVPIQPGTVGTLYHDRRFYFYKDMSKSTFGPRTAVIDESNTAKLEQLMEDNLQIYIVTGCTNTDGTAPDCMTFNSEGKSTSNPVIALGPPGGTYLAPSVLIGSPNLLPAESTCGEKNKFVRYNGHVNTAAGYTENNNNEAAVIVTGSEDDWIYAYKDANNRLWHRSSNVRDIRWRSRETTPFLKTAKYMSIVWNQVCGYTDRECQINSKQGALSIVQGTLEGLVGCAFGIGEAQQLYGARRIQTSAKFNGRADGLQAIGGLVQTGMTVQWPGMQMSASRQIACTYADLTTQSGTYVMNGRIITSQQGFIMDHGPFINWAPGYEPVIKYCNEQTIELYDCVNPYSVRRFVNIYHTEYPTKQIKKIHNISPRLSTGAKWDVDASVGMCVYNMDIADFDPVAFSEVPNTITNTTIGIYLQQMKEDKTCAFVPRCIPNKDLTTPVNILYGPNKNRKFFATGDEIPPPVYFSKNSEEPAWDTTNAVVLSATDKFNCATKEQSIINTFNDAHDGIPHFISATDRVSIKTRGGQKMCMFKGLFGSVYNPDTKTTANPTNSPSQAIPRNVTILLDDISGNYLSDDYPLNYTYTPIPIRSTWFDVPPRAPIQAFSTSFLRTGCTQDPVYNDCSNIALIDILVTQYNESNTNAKILKVLRSYTPVSIPNNPICDYDVERLKKVGTNTILHRETIRFFLEPGTEQCSYKLNLNRINLNASQINSGASLNLSDTLGMLVTPYTTAINYSTSIQRQFFSAMSDYIGYDIGGILNNTTTNVLGILDTLRTSLYSNTHLKSCPSKTCMDDTVIKAMINRYNFDSYPRYPPQQNSVTKNSIVRITKVGTATSTSCQMELYLRTDFFTDFLYTPLPQDVQYFMRAFAFNLFATSTPCTFKVKPFSPSDIATASMDISGDAFTLKCPDSENCPSAIKIGGRVSYDEFVVKDYVETMIRCTLSNNNDPVIQSIKSVYNKTPVFTQSGTKYYNTINSVLRTFNAMPNVIELKVTTQRVYWDSDYSTAYYTGKPTDEQEESYIIATWPDGTEYEVETGYYWKDDTGTFVVAPTTPISIVSGVSTATISISKDGAITNKTLTMCTPTIQEIFYPDLTFTATEIYKKNSDGTQTQVFLPYLANDGLIGVDSPQTARYSQTTSGTV